ncbi:hypothetical protein BN1184_AR_00740 [Pantoea ananatis]|nr:hypothetical protein BN1182_AW_00740 [Pantoea ananatis]CRH33244.1 hypothetical protein BN1183_AR_00730 [Pantoea ananatis]CRH37759.1 hypothetical protein BN1184_AR_00740 [Pantoea ananatis]
MPGEYFTGPFSLSHFSRQKALFQTKFRLTFSLKGNAVSQGSV